MSRETIIRATADIGRASGLEAAAKVMLAMTDHKRRVVGTQWGTRWQFNEAWWDDA